MDMDVFYVQVPIWYFLVPETLERLCLPFALVSMQVGEGLSQNKLVFYQPYWQIKTFLYACKTESHNFQTLITFIGGRECTHTHWYIKKVAVFQKSLAAKTNLNISNI